MSCKRSAVSGQRSAGLQASVLAGEYDAPVEFAKPARVLDIGANVGAFALWASRRWPGCKITGYEPMEESIVAARENCPGACFIEAAVTSRRRATLYRGLHNSGEASLYNLGEQHLDQRVVADTIHPRDLPKCDVLKLDTEGSELDILRHYRHRPRLIALEYHRQSDILKISALLMKRGYQQLRHTRYCPDRGILIFASASRFPLTADRSLFLATPCYGGTVTTGYMSSVLRLIEAAQRAGISVHWSAPNGEQVARARNRLVADFIESGCSQLFFVDSDITFRPEDALAMLRTGFDVVGGVYPLKNLKPDGKPDYVINLLPQSSTHPSIHSSRSCLPVAAIGTGFLLVSRAAILKLQRANPQLSYADDFPATRGRKTFALFDYGVEGNRYLSEDYRFCHRWRAIGGTVWAYPCPLDHQGIHIFRGDFAARCKPLNREPLNSTNPKENHHG